MHISLLQHQRPNLYRSSALGQIRILLLISEPREELPVRQRLLHGTKFLADLEGALQCVPYLLADRLGGRPDTRSATGA